MLYCRLLKARGLKTATQHNILSILTDKSEGNMGNCCTFILGCVCVCVILSGTIDFYDAKVPVMSVRPSRVTWGCLIRKAINPPFSRLNVMLVTLKSHPPPHPPPAPHPPKGSHWNTELFVPFLFPEIEEKALINIRCSPLSLIHMRGFERIPLFACRMFKWKKGSQAEVRVFYRFRGNAQGSPAVFPACLLELQNNFFQCTCRRFDILHHVRFWQLGRKRGPGAHWFYRFTAESSAESLVNVAFWPAAVIAKLSLNKGEYGEYSCGGFM